MSDFPQSDAGPSVQKAPAQNRSRSRACLHCRRRKMRCDGVKPACFQCVRAERGSECEYDDGTTKTQTQLLYERLQFLEKRLRELQAAKGSPKGRLSTRNDPGPSRRATRGGKNPISSHPPELQPEQPYAHSDRYANYVDSNAFSYSLPVQSTSRSPSLSGHSEGSLTPPSTTSSTLSFPTQVPQPLNGHPQPNYFPQPSTHQVHSQGYAYGQQPYEGSMYFSYTQPLEAMEQVNLHESELTPVPLNRPIGSPGLGRGYLHNEIPILLSTGQELPPEVCRSLFDICSLHGHQTGISPLPWIIDNPNLGGVPIAARYTACLWGAHFSNNDQYIALKPWFLRRVLEELPELMRQAQLGRDTSASACTDESLNTSICQAIRVSTALATYLYAHGRPIEGAYHASTAARLVLATGLHQTQLSLQTLPFSTGHSGENQSTAIFQQSYPSISLDPANSLTTGASSLELLAPAKTETEALRRLHTFWDCYIVERSWNAASGVPTSPWAIGPSFESSDERALIMAPWPEDWSFFGGETLVTPTLSSRTMLSDGLQKGTPYEDFIMGRDYGSQNRLEMRVKSAALFDLAAHLGEARDPSNQCPGYTPAVVVLQRVLTGFIKHLPPLRSVTFSSTTCLEYTLFTSHSMVHAAVIRLHYVAAGKAYEHGYVDGITYPIAKFGYVPEDKQQKAVIDGLLAYESIISQQEMQSPWNSQRMREPIPHDENTVKVTADAGRMMACLDKCLIAAREIVTVIQQIGPDQYSYLEPIVSHCWMLAAKVLLRELKRLSLLARQFPPSSPPPHVQSQTRSIVQELSVLLAGLHHVGDFFPIGVTHARKIEAALNAIPYRALV